jgi:hypothetical protein
MGYVFLNKEASMIRKRVLNPERVRRINGGFSFIPHRFVTDGFLSSLSANELLLYLFLVAVSDRCGLSFYKSESICSLLHMTADNYQKSRQSLIEKDLLLFDGTIFQVLELPEAPCAQSSYGVGLQALCKNLFKEV